jgi:hypothetical protein
MRIALQLGSRVAQLSNILYTLFRFRVMEQLHGSLTMIIYI